MRRSIIKEFDQLGESLSNQSAQFAYRMKNLCVKAEEVALLPVEILIEGEFQKLESCATIGKKDDYSFMVFPNYEEDLETMGKGIFRVHPEFKQKIESMQVDSVDEAGKNKSMDVHYILLTMPEVDDDRYDVLKDGVKVCYEECKARMEVLNRKADAKFAELTIGDTDEDVKKLKAAREKLNEQCMVIATNSTMRSSRRLKRLTTSGWLSVARRSGNAWRTRLPIMTMSHCP